MAGSLKNQVETRHLGRQTQYNIRPRLDSMDRICHRTVYNRPRSQSRQERQTGRAWQSSVVATKGELQYESRRHENNLDTRPIEEQLENSSR